jgi:hypothetical protein
MVASDQALVAFAQSGRSAHRGMARSPRHRHLSRVRWWPLVPFITALACGARTALVTIEESTGPSDGASDAADRTVGAGDALVEGAADTPYDVRAATVDDGSGADASRDVLPIDVVFGDAGCSPDATNVYLVTRQNELLRFDPRSLTTSVVGPISCPADAGAAPFAMAVSTRGTAVVLFDDGALFELNLGARWFGIPTTTRRR